MENLNKNSIDVFNYFDYYDYLKDYYENLKKYKIGFSFRSFAQNAGIPSHSYLLRIVQRKRKLSQKYVPHFCKALHLSTDECSYFSELVYFNNEKSSVQKEIHLKKILNLRNRRKKEYKLEDKKYQFFQHWYYPVIRELAVTIDFKDDFSLLARTCIPKITTTQAKGAITYLLDNNFISKNTDGTYSLKDYFMSTAKEVNSTIISKYHRTTIRQAADAIDLIKSERRDISSLTLRVNQESFNEIKTEIQNFRKHLLDIARKSEDPDMVCFVGLQLLPRSEEFIKNEDINGESDDI